jgi:hypothetical protein
MKTAEEWYQEWLGGDLMEPTGDIFERIQQDAIQSVQRWISVDEELPLIDESNEFSEKYGWSKTVLAKNTNSVYIAEYNHNGKTWNIKGTSVFHPITHWRQI